jgi:LPXTG-motif cell wall-anchored protein
MKKTTSALIAGGILALSLSTSVPAMASSGYPAPEVTPNTTGQVQATPAPVKPQAVEPKLAETGADASMLIWGSVGVAALGAGAASVIYVRRKAS